jgi:uncharacterized protein YqhQ
MSGATGMKLYGKHFSVKVTEEGYIIKRSWSFSPLMLFPIFDAIIFAVYLVGASRWFAEFVTTLITGSHSQLFWDIIICLAIIAGSYIVLKIPQIIEVLRRFKRWHGCEHKVIAAAENNDLGNARNYSRINDRCGATFMLSILITYALWMSFIGPFGIFSITYLIMVIESKLFHRYNVFGIYLGRKIQEHATTAEPPQSMLNVGENAMDALIQSEAIS